MAILFFLANDAKRELLLMPNDSEFGRWITVFHSVVFGFSIVLFKTIKLFAINNKTMVIDGIELETR